MTPKPSFVSDFIFIVSVLIWVNLRGRISLGLVKSTPGHSATISVSAMVGGTDGAGSEDEAGFVNQLC